ncbi:hypothetical protein A1O3_09406 [Capronia epimyces CBS 606.96]|uniref:CPAF-like PDZ domain-containing protein n=1 Tax=Capronia epimyces CBS 606.96 TaxID=1182542 RepID=W9XLN4_9EURO|nr:uncharacterized protein A1O3_09406 [Capronia epimyces CBS 606.96]EXJ78245.1 hypothetical protein A1O3_09406 [Capronia epimyces CBS 606.96]
MVTATSVAIDADLAYACLKSVPNHQGPAIRLLNSLRTYLEFQSTKDYLPDPPSGYLFSAVDLDAGLDNVLAKVQQEGYDSEYDMQADIFALLTAARDRHLLWFGDLMGTFTFKRPASLVAVSSDGEQTPQVYISSDLVFADNRGSFVPVTGYTPSPVESINGLDVVSFLLARSWESSCPDPDALWNELLLSLAGPGKFTYPTHYPGAFTNVTLANGTTREYRNIAIVNVAMHGVASGEDAYAVFCPEANVVATMSTAASSTVPSMSTPAQSNSPIISDHARLVIKHSADSVAGYYLSEPGLTDVAILKVSNFKPSTTVPANYEGEFQMVVQKFLDAALRTGKRKLIIDLQSNTGGFIDLGTDLFAQLFPTIPPNSKSNMRAHLGLQILGNVASSIVATAEMTSNGDHGAEEENRYVPLAFQTVVDPESRNFADFQSFYGPQQLNGGQFTAFFQNNYTDPVSSDYQGQGIIITGTNNRTGFRQPFAPQDIVVLTDGLCGSTCAVLSEQLKNHGGVQFISIGGRPQPGPMQAVGDTKGAQIFPQDKIAIWVDLFRSREQNPLLDEANGTIWENFTDVPILRASYGSVGVNGRNNFRIGDKTQTPLQFTYEAADCRLWWTREMLYDGAFLWARVARMAFKERRGTQFNSKYCVTNSTGHPTSLSGGWKPGTFGPQQPPPNAKAVLEGWKLDGRPLGSVLNAVNAELK